MGNYKLDSYKIYAVQWLTVCVNLTGPWGTKTFGQTFQLCFCMTLTFELVHWIKQVALPNVGGPHPKKDPNRTKRLNNIISSPWQPSLGHWSFPDIELEWKFQFFLGLKYSYWHLPHWFCRVSGFHTWTRTISLIFLGLSTSDIGTFKSPYACDSIPYKKYLSFIYI